MAMYFPNPKAYASITLAGSCFSGKRSDVAVAADVPIKHVIVYKEPGRFCGWPANNGAWNWGNGILVCFDLHYFKEPDPTVDPRASTLLHEILVLNMKAKKTTDLSNVDKLKALLAEFRVAYFRTATVKD
jgi:hypothetical protein